MSLNSALEVGRSAMTVSQIALQLAGNNMANAATEGYHRQTIHLTPARGESLGNGNFVGRGVQLLAIRREVDTALQSRYRDALSEEHSAQIDQRFLTTIETIQNELTDNDISSLLSDFFNAFSELANNPEDNAVRAVVIQQGANLASRIADLRNDYDVVIQEVDRSLGNSVARVNDLLEQIALLNGQVTVAEGGEGGANALRDQRDLLIDELAQFMDVTVIEQSGGAVDVLVGSVPVLLGAESRGVELRRESVGDVIEVSVRVAADGTELTINSGTIGGLLNQREQTVQPVIDDLDTFAGQLIFQVNRLHSQGQGRDGFSSVTGTYKNLDPTANLNATAAGLPFRIQNGSFFIHVTHSETGTRSSYQINVDGDAMSLDDLIDEINTVVGVPNVTAGKGLANELTLQADSGYEITFSDDTCGALAALGINTFFCGENATDIDVNQVLKDDANLLAAGADHLPGSTDTALAIADLQDVQVEELGNRSLREFWQNAVNDLAVRNDAANTAVESSRLVRESLFSQIQAVVGVSLDEESINLLTFQQQFKAAARFINVIEETIQTLLSIA
ncbi:MAG: flagellar hook-associated protein FlgK [Phycisphaerales bacterium]|nr:MAG: flagellar hook-associated protein FlgK [Phycisphaerales bacterium]